MIFRKKRYRQITINIRPTADFKKILEILDEIILPKIFTKPQDIKYAVLELINNSLRAHRENNIPDPLTLTFKYNSPSLTVIVHDKGQGFNPTSLPYSLSDDPHNIDIKSDLFAQYREENNYLRFGMGLYLVRKTFPVFKLTFLDQNRNPVQWGEGEICGTLITVSIKGGEDEL